jgi:hypothetical protein
MLTMEPKTRRAYFGLALVTMVACALILWGLQSKLSLYHSASVESGVPIAKLLSERERPVSTGRAEAPLLLVQPFHRALHRNFPGAVGALAASLQRRDLQSSEAFVQPESSPTLPQQRLTRTTPRAPPII